MRRVLSLFLVLLYGLGPFARLLPASAESRLPVCCRRHGAHHCSMAAMTAGGDSSTAPAFTSPAHCPYYPGDAAAATTASHALAVALATLLDLLPQTQFTAAILTVTRQSQIPTGAGRGPPSLLIG